MFEVGVGQGATGLEITGQVPVFIGVRSQSPGIESRMKIAADEKNQDGQTAAQTDPFLA